MFDNVREDKVIAFGMLRAECHETCGIEVIRGLFALDGYWFLSMGRKYKVHFMPALVSPVKYFSALRASHDFIQHEVFP